MLLIIILLQTETRSKWRPSGEHGLLPDHPVPFEQVPDLSDPNHRSLCTTAQRKDEMQRRAALKVVLGRRLFVRPESPVSFASSTRPI